MRNDGELRGECAACGSAVTPAGFDGWPEVFAREWPISGLCPACQVDVFAPAPDEECRWRTTPGFCARCAAILGFDPESCPSRREGAPR
ncbi:MAG: hypothetical protein M0031_10485 [Thermaerobacter sp.]|nr:hypothetical protein [Thermaerobacter sp.]